MNPFYLARQLLRRDWRSGELLTLVAALIIAVTAVFTIALITERLTLGMARESAELVGGDLAIRSTRDPDPDWQRQADSLGVRNSLVYRFDSVVFHGEEMLLASIKAVDSHYPLIGKLQTSEGPGQAPRVTDGIPAPGTAWVDPRVLERLNAKLGSQVQFGATTLTLDRLLTYEPDQANSLFQLAPRILINSTDLEAAAVLGPGSRIRYRTLFHSADLDAIATLRDRIEPSLGTGHDLIDPATEDNRAATALQRATQYIRIATLLTVILAAIAISLAATRYSRRHYDVGAMLRCLGAQQREVIRLYAYQLVLLTLAALVTAYALGWLVHLGIIAVMRPLLPVDLPWAGAAPWFIAGSSAFLLVAGFVLPPVLRLGRTPPLRVLRRDLSPAPLSAWLIYGAAAIAQIGLLWLLFDDLPSILVVLLATAAGILLTGVLLQRGLQALRQSAPGNRGLLGRSVRNLAAHSATTASQIIAFSLTLMLIVVITQLRSGLLEEWRIQLPENTPNHFAFNIFPDQVERFSSLVAEKGELSPLYPIVRGRVVAINGQPGSSGHGDDDDGHRELNFTWTDALPKDNRILAGEWPPRGNGVSLEQEYAQERGLAVGDQLTIDITGSRFNVEVTSIRSVEWSSFTPNFFVIFSGEQLEDYSATYLTSFHLTKRDPALLRTLFTEFPAITLIEVDALLERLEQVLGQVSLSVELVMIFVLLSGFAVLFATLQTTADERLQEGALMRAVGASRHYLKRAYLTEFGLLGLIAGVLAVIGAEIICAYVYIGVFELDYTPTLWLWLVLPLATTAVVAIAGYLGNRRPMNVSPVVLLNR